MILYLCDINILCQFNCMMLLQLAVIFLVTVNSNFIMDSDWHAMMLLWSNYIIEYRIIRGTIGNYQPPLGYTEKDYVLHGQLATIYNDVRLLKSIVDKDGTDLIENTDNDLYTRIFLVVISTIILIFSFLFKIRLRIQKLRNGTLQSTNNPTVHMGTIHGTAVPQYAQGVCTY